MATPARRNTPGASKPPVQASKPGSNQVRDPVVAATRGSTVIAWVDKDNWKDGKPGKRVPRYFLDIRVRGLLNHEIHGASAADIESLAKSLTDLAHDLRNPTTVKKNPRYSEE